GEGTAWLLRAAMGLQDLWDKLEKAKAEEATKQAAVAALPPAEVREELDHWLDGVAEKMRQADAAEREREQQMGKCLRCGQALPSRVNVEGETPVREEPKPPGPG